MSPTIEPQPARPGRPEQELLRLTFCGIVIASFFAAVGTTPALRNLLSPGGTNVATTVLGLSAAFGFAYLLSVAAALKYQAPSRVDRFPINPKTARFFYDASINIYGIYILALVVQWLDVHFLHLPGNLLLIPVYLLLFGVCYVVARIAWYYVQRGIEKYYDFESRRK